MTVSIIVYVYVQSDWKTANNTMERSRSKTHFWPDNETRFMLYQLRHAFYSSYMRGRLETVLYFKRWPRKRRKLVALLPLVEMGTALPIVPVYDMLSAN